MQKNTRNFHIRKKGVFLREMRHLGNNRFAKTVLLLCVLMQAVALMPHHHHGDPTAVCLNYSHINGANPCRNVCTGTGSHNTQPYASCASHSLTVAQPQPREEVALQGFGDAPCTESYIRIFLTAAVPCRAPDFMC